MKKFLLGITTVIVGIPILESITEVICSYLEVAKINSTKKVMLGNKEIQDLQSELEEIDTQAIGFQYEPIEEYYEEDDEEWEDEDKLKNKNKIGFIC